MQERTAVNQSPGGGTLYPFSDQGTLVGVVLDFYLSYDDDDCAYALPFSLTVAGTALAVHDFQGLLVASGDVSGANATSWGTRAVYEWLGASTVMRIVTPGLADGTGVLDPRTVDRMPGRVRSLRVGLQTFAADLAFESGYNYQMTGVETTRTDGTRYIDQVNMDAVPGAGMGRQPGCVETLPLVRKINNVLPDAGGNFIIQADDCFRNQLTLQVVDDPQQGQVARYGKAGMTAEQAKASITLFSDCHPCMDCSYFVRTYRGLKRVWNKWLAVAHQAEAVRDTYEANRQRWLDQLNCRLDNPARLVAISEPNCKGFIGGAYCNTSKSCISPVEVRFTLQKYKAGVPESWPTTGVQVVESYLSGSSTQGEVKAVPVVSGAVFRFNLDYSDPQQTSMARFRLCVTCAADESLRVTLTVHAPDPPPAPHTGVVTILPTPAVPADILAIWTASGIDHAVDYAARAVVQKVMPFNPVPPVYDCAC